MDRVDIRPSVRCICSSLEHRFFVPSLGLLQIKRLWTFHAQVVDSYVCLVTPNPRLSLLCELCNETWTFWYRCGLDWRSLRRSVCGWSLGAMIESSLSGLTHGWTCNLIPLSGDGGKLESLACLRELCHWCVTFKAAPCP